MTWTKKTKWTIVVAAAVATAFYLAISPVLFRLPFQEENTSEPRFVLLNPLRDKSPEIFADHILALMKEGQCANIIETASKLYLNDKKHVCDMVSETGLLSWQLRNRTNTRHGCKLYYWHDGGEGVWVELSGGSKEGWRLVGFNIIS